MCNCGVYVRINNNDPRFVFIDHCDASPSINKQFSYFDKTFTSNLRTADLPLLDCNYTITNDNSVAEWSAIPVSRNYFQCARLNTSVSFCEESYVLRAKFSTKIIKLKVDVKCDNKYGLSRVEVNPVAGLDYITSGLCGKTVSDSELPCSLHFEIDESHLACLSSSSGLGINWK